MGGVAVVWVMSGGLSSLLVMVVGRNVWCVYVRSVCVCAVCLCEVVMVWGESVCARDVWGVVPVRV